MRMDTAGGDQSKYLGFNDKADEAWTDLTSSRYAPSTGTVLSKTDTLPRESRQA